MLVLSREINQTIEIGTPGMILTEPIRITVVCVRGDKVRIGCQSQRDLPINRQEIADKIRAQVGEEGK